MLESIAARIVVGLIAALGSLRFGTGIYFWRVTEALERPTYTVIEKLSDGVELRQYEPYLIAETIVDGVGFREPTRDGFRACAGYIFGKNKPASSSGWFAKGQQKQEPEKMAMTAPVRVSGEAPPSLKNKNAAATSSSMISAGGGSSSDTITMKKTKVSFVIGNKYSLKTAPIPMDDKVKIRQVPAHTLAVRTFSGPPPKDERVQKEREIIEKALAKAGKLVPGPNEETLVYGYHDPFITPNFLRRNEVALVVEGSV
jgi:hypothetical protein